MENVVIILVLAVLVGGAVAYLIRAKRNGVKCVGCPAGGSCNSSRKPAKKKLDGPVIGKKTIRISGMSCAHCAMSVTDSLNKITGARAEVNLSRGNAIVSYDREISDELLRQAVEKAGFAVVEIL